MAELGPWRPMPVADVRALFRGAPLRWLIGGGRALELHVGRTWRDHDDTDIGVVRGEVSGLLDVFHGWDLRVAAAGELTRWNGAALEADRQQNNLWCRPTPTEPWCLDVTIGDGDDDRWIYRRDPKVTARWDEAVLTS